MYISLIAMLKAWSNVLTKPGERTFATERSKASATLKTALVWILLAGLMISLLDIMRTALSEMWVLPPDELEWPSLPSNFTIFLDQYIGNLSIRILNLNFEFAKMYGWLWIYTGLFDLTANSVYRIANYIVLEIPSWIRDIAKGLLQPVSLLIKVGMYHCVATLWGGRGQFGRYAYLLAAIGAPISILYALLDFLPLAGGGIVAILPGSSFMAGQIWYYRLQFHGIFFISYIVLAFWLVLFYFATKVEHELSWWRAIIVVVISYPLVYILGTIHPYGWMGLFDAAKMIQR